VVPLGQWIDFSKPAFSRSWRDYRPRQEFITRYTPEQNGLIERFFRSIKKECVWQHNFTSFAEARTTITQRRMVQRRTAPPGSRLSQAAAVSRATTSTHGLIIGGALHAFVKNSHCS
jgi:transposase InsO family protein